MVVRKCGFGDFHMDFLGWGMLHTCRIYEAYPFESSESSASKTENTWIFLDGACYIQ